MELLAGRLLGELILELVLLHHKISSGEIGLDAGVTHGVMPRGRVERDVGGSHTSCIKLTDGVLVERTTLEVLSVRSDHDDRGTESIDVEAHRDGKGVAAATVIVLLHANVPAISDKLICGLVVKHEREIAISGSVVLGLSTGEVLKSDLVIAKSDLFESVVSHD